MFCALFDSTYIAPKTPRIRYRHIIPQQKPQRGAVLNIGYTKINKKASWNSCVEINQNISIAALSMGTIDRVIVLAVFHPVWEGFLCLRLLKYEILDALSVVNV